MACPLVATRIELYTPHITQPAKYLAHRRTITAIIPNAVTAISAATGREILGDPPNTVMYAPWTTQVIRKIPSKMSPVRQKPPHNLLFALLTRMSRGLAKERVKRGTDQRKRHSAKDHQCYDGGIHVGTLCSESRPVIHKPFLELNESFKPREALVRRTPSTLLTSK